jgi:hypothetical protein
MEEIHGDYIWNFKEALENLESCLMIGRGYSILRLAVLYAI